MKKLKKIFAVICSLAMVTSVTATVANAAEVANPLVTISMVDNTATNNSVTINFNTTLSTVSSTIMGVKVSDNLKPYIASWSWDTDVAVAKTKGVTASSTYAKTSYITGNYSISAADGGEQATNGVLGSLTINFIDGGVPSTVSLADRTITIAGFFKSNTNKAATNIANSTTTVTYAYDTTDDNTKAPTNYWVVDPTATGNYVVVPTASAPTDPWVAAEQVGSYTGDKGFTSDGEAVAYKAQLDLTSRNDYITWAAKFNGTGKGIVVNAPSADGEGKVYFGLIIGGLDGQTVSDVYAGWGELSTAPEAWEE